MYLRSADVDRYGPLFDYRPPIGDGITVISGPNEAGKSLYLEAVLRLLDPAVEDVMHPSPRVRETPTGRVVVEHNGSVIECTGDAAICEQANFDPRHLQSIFVVQDTDLALPREQEYYTSLVETLGDIHTTEIERITDSLKDRGRLTDTRLNIASSQSADNARTVHEEAETLAGQIRSYVEEVEAEGLDELAARRLDVQRAITATRTELDEQAEAKTVAEYEHLSTQLETYRSASETLSDLEAVDRDSLETLRERHNSLEHDRDELVDVEEQIKDRRSEIETLEQHLDELRDRQAELDNREPGVDTTRQRLQTYRDQRATSRGTDRWRTMSRWAMVAGLVGAGLAGAAGAISGSLGALGLGALLLLVGITGGVLSVRATQQEAAVETARKAVLEAARDAGFDVASIEDVAPAIEAYDQEVETVERKRVRTDQALTTAREELEDLEAKRETLEREIDGHVEHRDEMLAAVDVGSIEAYEDLVERKEEAIQERETAKQSLIDRFGEPGDRPPMEKADSWAADLEEMIADIDLEEVEGDTFDEEAYDELQADIETLEAELRTVTEALEEHDDTLDEFDERARGLRSGPFVGRSLQLPARSVTGLEALADDLEAVVTAIERDADLSRKAIDLFETIERREEQKMTDLFDPAGPASETFERLTDGRYTEVAYDADEHAIVVERADGRTFGPETLSQGTTDQLYFASRVSLAQQLLGEDTGFLILDDPFLAADYDRLHRGFQTLLELAESGWQILYLTAKREVAESMVETYDLAHIELEGPSGGM